MYSISNLYDNKNIVVKEEVGNIKILEHLKDLSVTHFSAATEYFAEKMNVRKRQAVIELKNTSFITSAGAMQWMLGDVKQTSGVKNVGDLVGKMFGAKVSNESVIKPVYSGTGILMLEPTYKHLITVDVSEWGTIVLDDGLFYACDGGIHHQIKARRNISSAILGKEGLFNLSLSGNGYAILESPVPAEELIRIDLENDEIKIDGNFAIAWSDGLDFRTETVSKNILTSAASKEGFVNVYRGTGSILLAPVLPRVKSEQLPI